MQQREFKIAMTTTRLKLQIFKVEIQQKTRVK